MYAGLKEWLEKLASDRDFRKKIGVQIQDAKSKGGEWLRDLGIDPKQDAVYLGVGAIVATALSADELSESSERLEGLTRELVRSSERLVLKTHELVSATNVLKVLTAALVVLTAVLVWRTIPL